MKHFMETTTTMHHPECFYWVGKVNLDKPYSSNVVASTYVVKTSIPVTKKLQKVKAVQLRVSSEKSDARLTNTLIVSIDNVTGDFFMPSPTDVGAILKKIIEIYDALQDTTDLFSRQCSLREKNEEEKSIKHKTEYNLLSSWVM